MTEQYNPYSEDSDSTERISSSCQEMALAMAYVRKQEWETPYDAFDGMDRGTLFPGLDKPFLGGGNR